MGPLSIVLLVLSCSLDNLVVGLAYGAGNVSVPFSSNLLIAIVTSCGTMLCVFAGRLFGHFLSPGLAHAIGSLALAAAGGWLIVREALGQPRSRMSAAGVPLAGPAGGFDVRALSMILDDPMILDVRASGRLGARQVLMLGLALSLNNFANGFAAGVAGSSVLVMTAALVAVSLLMMWAGLAIGRHCPPGRAKDAMGTIAGLILLATGVREYLS